MDEEKKYKSYKSEHSIQDIIGLVNRVLGSNIKKIDRIDCGEINAVYFISLDNGSQCVVRVSPAERKHNSFAQEAWAFARCREIGVPTPKVLALDTALQDFSEAYMISERIFGIPGNEAKKMLTEAQKMNIYRQLGHYFFMIHSVKVLGFGRLIEEQDKFTGRFNTTWDYIEYELKSGWWIKPLLSNGIITEEHLVSLRSRFEENKVLFELDSASLVHGDLSPFLGNVIIDISRNQITGIVDMENVAAMDPVFDFARFHFWKEGDGQYFEALKKGYDNQGLFNDNFTKKLCFYELLNAYSLMAYYYGRNNMEAFKSARKKAIILGEEIDKIS